MMSEPLGRDAADPPPCPSLAGRGVDTLAIEQSAVSKAMSMKGKRGFNEV